jgi:hypothetical protein
MSDTPTKEGRGVWVSYAKLLEFEKGQLEIKNMLAGFMTMAGQVKDHEIRISALETVQEVNRAVSGTWKSIRVFVYGAASALVGGGALTFLPTFLGWVTK